MSDLSTSVNTTTSLDVKSKEGMVALTKSLSTDKTHTDTVEPLHDKPSPKLPQSTATDFNYTVEKDTNAIHLKIVGKDGQLVRELVFNKSDVNPYDLKKLRGVFVDEGT